MSTELTRRALLAGGLALAGGGLLGGGGCSRPLSEKELAVLRLARSAGLPEAGLGKGYLELHPDEADERTLLELLFAEAGEDADETALRELFARQVENDWLELETVQVEGWVLARAEGRLLALESLLRARSGQA